MRKGDFLKQFCGFSPETPLKIKLLSLSLYVATTMFI